MASESHSVMSDSVAPWDSPGQSKKQIQEHLECMLLLRQHRSFQ